MRALLAAARQRKRSPLQTLQAKSAKRPLAVPRRTKSEHQKQVNEINSKPQIFLRPIRLEQTNQSRLCLHVSANPPKRQIMPKRQIVCIIKLEHSTGANALARLTYPARLGIVLSN